MTVNLIIKFHVKCFMPPMRFWFMVNIAIVSSWGKKTLRKIKPTRTPTVIFSVMVQIISHLFYFSFSFTVFNPSIKQREQQRLLTIKLMLF